MNRGKIFVPLRPDKLRSGEEINFNIYVKSDDTGSDRPEYSLFCRRGEIFSPGLFSKIKFDYNQCVYYHRRDQDKVEYYLNPDLTLVLNAQFLRPVKRLGAALANHKEVYVALPLKNLQPGAKVNFDVFNKTKCIKKRDYNYNIFIPQGNLCQPALIADLYQKGSNYVYFRGRDGAEVLKYLYHHLSLVLKDNKIPPLQKAEKVYDTALIWTRRFYHEEQVRSPQEMQAGFKLIACFFNILSQDKEHRQWLPGLRRHGEQLPAHVLHTAILGTAFTRYLGWPKQEVLEFAAGALLHDIGMVEVPQKLLTKPGRLSKVEMDLIKKHPQDSCRIIKEISSLSLNPMLMILQHHEFGDGSGYLQGLKLAQINHWARIFRIIDSYEAMISNRSWREKYDSLDALQEIRKDWSDRGIFDTNYLIEFIKFLSGN